MKDLPSIAIVYEHADSDSPIIVVDEGQDFDALLTEWAEFDDKVDSGDISEDNAMTLGEFLMAKGVTVFDDPAVYTV
jgi:hypothetical protein